VAAGGSGPNLKNFNNDGSTGTGDLKKISASSSVREPEKVNRGTSIHDLNKVTVHDCKNISSGSSVSDLKNIDNGDKHKKVGYTGARCVDIGSGQPTEGRSHAPRKPNRAPSMAVTTAGTLARAP
jgi:hypothetical protein